MLVYTILLIMISAAIGVNAVEGRLRLLHHGTKADGGIHCSNATYKATLECMAPYFKSFGFDITHVPGYLLYENITRKMWRSGKKGVVAVCKPTRTLGDCLERIPDFKTCQSTLAYEALLHLSREESEDYFMDHVRRGYECAHEDVLLANYECILRADDDHAPANNCLDQLAWDMYRPISICVAIESYAKCMTAIYVNHCGPAVSNFFCNVEQNLGKAAYPKCENAMPACAEDLPIQSFTSYIRTKFTKLFAIISPFHM